MKTRLSLKRKKWLRRSNGPAALLTALMALAPLAAQAGVPDWMRQAASATTPKYPDDTNAVILLDLQSTTVSDNGEIKTTIRRVYRILRPQAHQYGTVVVPIGSGTHLAYLRGWAFGSDRNEYEVKEKDCVETSLFNDALYEDARHRVCQLPAALPGSVLGYEFELQLRPDVLQHEWAFQGEDPVLRARFELRLPQGWEYDSYWLNHAAAQPETLEKGGLAWELNNIPAIEKEPNMPPWEALAGRLAITFYRRGGGGGQASPASWQDVARGYARLAEDRVQASADIKQKVAELTRGKPDALTNIQALADFVQHQVRYVAIEIGIGGYQPHPASEIFAKGYGDCKDKATLLSAMLSEMGVESHFVLVNTNRNLVEAKFPSMLNFDHVILAIRIPENISTITLFASEQHKSLGTVLYFDPTDTAVPLGYLPWELQGSWGLFVGKDGGELVQLPLLPPAVNRLLRVAKLSVDAQGNVQAEVQEIRWGEPAFTTRARLLALQESQRQQSLEEFVGQFVGASSVVGSQVQHLADYNSSLMVQYRLLAKGYAKLAGNMLLLRPRLLGEKSSGILEEKERKYPVEFPNTGLDSDSFEFVLPSGYEVEELPEPVNIQSPFADYHSQVQVAGNVLKYQRNFTVKAVEVPLDRVAELKKFYRDVEADERSTVILKPAAH